VGTDEVVGVEGDLDLVVQRIEGGEEHLDRLTLARAAPLLAVVDEVLRQQTLARGRVTAVDRLGVEPAHEGDVVDGGHVTNLIGGRLIEQMASNAELSALTALARRVDGWKRYVLR